MPATRISTNQVFTTNQTNIGTAKEREQITTEKAASLKAINRVSQDPTGWVLAADMKDDRTVRETLSKNAGLANHVLSATDNVLSQIQEYVQQGYEMALSVSGHDQNSEGSRSKIQPASVALRSGLQQIINTKYGQRTLLAGLKSTDRAFDDTGKYLGDKGVFNVEIEEGLMLPLNIDGASAVLGEGQRDGVNIIAAMDQLVEGLANNDEGKIQGTIDMFTKANEQISNMRAKVGGSQKAIENALRQHDVSIEQATDSISKIEDADVIKVFSDLAKDQTVLRIAVGTTQKMLSEMPTELLFK